MLIPILAAFGVFALFIGVMLAVARATEFVAAVRRYREGERDRARAEKAEEVATLMYEQLEWYRAQYNEEEKTQ